MLNTLFFKDMIEKLINIIKIIDFNIFDLYIYYDDLYFFVKIKNQ